MPQGLLNFSWCKCSVPRRHLYEGGVYLKSNLFLANYSVATNHFNFSKKKKQPTWCSACQKGHLFYCSQFHNFQVNITAIHRVNKDLMSDLLLNIRTGIFKRICVWFTQNLWLRSKHWLVCALLVSYFITATLLLSTIFHTIIKKGNCIVQIIFLTCKGNVWKLAIAFKENKSTLRKQEFL